MNVGNPYYCNSLRVMVMIAACCFVSCQLSTVESRSVRTAKETSRENAININTASARELEKIPYIGAKIAEKIVAYRTANGPFRKAEHLMFVDGISDRRFRQIKEFVRVE